MRVPQRENKSRLIDQGRFPETMANIHMLARARARNAFVCARERHGLTQNTKNGSAARPQIGEMPEKLTDSRSLLVVNGRHE